MEVGMRVDGEPKPLHECVQSYMSLAETRNDMN